jgi:hypothetical protein
MDDLSVNRKGAISAMMNGFRICLLRINPGLHHLKDE